MLEAQTSLESSKDDSKRKHHCGVLNTSPCVTNGFLGIHEANNHINIREDTTTKNTLTQEGPTNCKHPSAQRPGSQLFKRQDAQKKRRDSAPIIASKRRISERSRLRTIIQNNATWGVITIHVRSKQPRECKRAELFNNDIENQE